ncbi:histidine phosphatase family protein [Tersicoccus solisilvae]|uniref:histidine phosphatase family protein n=1 Tax=Tersicoccus solisilvae TaxID=1882339 RepID=UPI001E5CE712|nr:histidine phosphatase family protein [Tersicoccus solisilvae]
MSGYGRVRRLILARHGESEANRAAAEADAAGAERIAVPARDADVELSATGREQAEALGHHLADAGARLRPVSVWVSPYVRARQTTEIALRTGGLDLTPRVDERLRDRELGILDALTGRGVRALHPSEAERRQYLGKFYYRPPGGESWADVALRVRSLLADIESSAGEGHDDDVLIVCHDAVVSLIRYVCERVEEQDLLEDARVNPMPNAAVTVLERIDGASGTEPGWRAVTVNDVAHLTRHDAAVTRHSGETDDTTP